MSPADWTIECQDVFQSLKQALLDSVVLAHPYFNKPFILSVDASTYGLGACLSQVAEGEQKARPVAFSSKSLNQAPSRYPAHHLEFLALKWAIKFSHWLKGKPLTVWTDNKPLTYILTKPKLGVQIGTFDFDIKYVPGVQNVIPDLLSRIPFIKGSVIRRFIQEPYRSLVNKSFSLMVSRMHSA